MMSLEAARNLSVKDLLHVLNEKLNLECTKVQVSPAMSTQSLRSEVSETPLTNLKHSDIV